MTESPVIAANALIQLLGGFPLALEHATAYIRTTQCTLQQYIEIFQEEEHRKQLMTMSGEITSPLGQSPIAHVWQVSFKHLESRFASSVALFNLMVFLDGSWVPEKLISTGFPGIRDAVFAASEETSSNDVAQTGPPWRLDNGLRFNEAIAHPFVFPHSSSFR